MQPTNQQHDAIHISDKNLIVVAGAGSGKTRVLVERYLQLLESNPDWRINSLVAITFTREAAFEMRHRLRLELERRAQKPDGDLWALHLSQLDSARIDTIHGLCAAILRANAAQAGIDPKFEVMDENDSAILLDDIVDDVLASIQAPLSALFAQYDSFRIENTLKQINLTNTDHPQVPDDPEALFRQWEQEWADAVYGARQGLLSSEDALAIETLPSVPMDDKLGELVKQYRRYLLEISLGVDATTVHQQMADCRKKGSVGNKGSAKNWGSKEAKDHAAQSLRDLRDRIMSALNETGEPPGELDWATAKVLPLWHKLLRLVQTNYRERKRENAQLDFDDLERLAADLLRDKSVRERYRLAEFKHLLVDEFQDTNAAQWQIIRSLADLQRGGSLFVVGDPKQSIYQFRGADVSVFNRVRDQIAGLDSGCAMPLSTSFRSHLPLVEQINALFERILVRDESSPVKDFEVKFDEPMEAFRADPPALPAIELQLLDSEIRDESGQYVRGSNRRRKGHSAEDMRRWEAYEIAQRIRQLIADGRPIYDKVSGSIREMEYRDIAILFQSMTKLTLYEDVFKSQEIPFLTVAGRGYYDRQEVWDMLDLLRFLHNPADNLSLATVLRSPIFAFSDDLLFALRLITDEDVETSEPISLWRALHFASEESIVGMNEQDLPLVRHALDTLLDLRRVSGRVTISELLRRALAKTNYLAILTGLPDGARRRGNIEKLLQLAQDSGKITVGKFSQYLADLSTREVREGEALLEAGNAICLMTVHASKGLEFPLVFLADASWERGNFSAPTLLSDPEFGLTCQIYVAETNKYENGFAHRRNFKLQSLKEAAERKRLLYVAATRAQDYLLVSGAVKLNRQDEWSSGGWLQLLMNTLDISDKPRAEVLTLPLAGYDIRVNMPSAPPPSYILYQSANFADNLWDFDADAREFPPLQPPLLAPLPRYDLTLPSHITVTQIAFLGTYRHGLSERQRRSYGRRFRETALNNIPEAVYDQALDLVTLSPRLIGEIVHELLRYGNFTVETEASDEIIRSIAWGHGLTNPAALRSALQEVRTLVSQYTESEVYRWIESARADGRPLYTELPFIFRTEKRVLHGAMDVLLRQRDGEWLIIDYKTSTVSGGDFVGHTSRYRLQLGVYAVAVREQLGLDHLPYTCIHYIRGNHTVALESEDCLSELNRLESTIGELVPPDA